MFQKKTPYEKERELLARQEAAWIADRRGKQESPLSVLLDGKVPAGLQNTLRSAFFTAFETVFSRGSTVIEKTYSGQAARKTYEINRCAAYIRPDRKNLRAFSKEARRTARGNTAISGAAGIGMGLLGIGLPDIPILVGLLLKSIRQIAQSYGYTVSSDTERYFMLLLLECAVSRGADAVEKNRAVSVFAGILAKHEPMQVSASVLSAQMHQTADTLAKALLYLKFVQTIPVVGVIGGLSDIGITHTVTEYAERKYRYRFYTEKEQNLQ